MDPLELYKAHVKVYKPEIVVRKHNGEDMIYNDQGRLCGPVDKDPDYLRIKKCCDKRKAAAGGPIFVCYCGVCSLHLLQMVYMTTYGSEGGGGS